MDEKNSPRQFLQDRDKWIRLVNNDRTLEHTAARVGVHLAMRMRGDQQFCWPSIKTISTETGVSMRAVSSGLDALCGRSKDWKEGEEPDREIYVFRTSRRNVGNVYSLFFKWR